MPTVALVGADGAGKSTITRALATSLGPDVPVIYMGVSLESSTMLLPPAMVLRRLRRRRASRSEAAGEAGPRKRGGLLASVRPALRIGYLTVEEWSRQVAVTYHRLRGRTIVFDRHFVYDYYYVEPAPGPGAWARRLHVRALRRLYPRPDVTIVLVAPLEVLASRRSDPVEELERKQAEYRRLAAELGFPIVSTDGPIDRVVAELRRIVADQLESATDGVA